MRPARPCLAAHNSEEDPPALAIESAYSERLGTLRADLTTWVTPRPMGGGASLALGINITRPTVLLPWRLACYMAAYEPRTGQAILGEPFQFGEDTGCEAVSSCS